jgi:hypothetical protein
MFEVHGGILLGARNIRSKKPEGPTGDCQKPEDEDRAEQAFLLASGFWLLASGF